MKKICLCFHIFFKNSVGFEPSNLFKCQKNTFPMRKTPYNIAFSVHKQSSVYNTTYTIQCRVNCLNVFKKLYWFRAIKLFECQKKNTFEIRNTPYNIAFSVHKQSSVFHTTYTIQSHVNCPIKNTCISVSTTSIHSCIIVQQYTQYIRYSYNGLCELTKSFSMLSI